MTIGKSKRIPIRWIILKGSDEQILKFKKVSCSNFLSEPVLAFVLKKTCLGIKVPRETHITFLKQVYTIIIKYQLYQLKIKICHCFSKHIK